MAPVTVEGWGTFHVRELTVEASDRLRTAKAAEGEEAISVVAANVASIICDENGRLLFDAANREDIGFLKGMGYSKLSQVLAKAANLGEPEKQGTTEAGN